MLLIVFLLFLAAVVIILPVIMIKRIMRRPVRSTFKVFLIFVSLSAASLVGTLVSINTETLVGTSIDDYEIQIKVDYDFEVADGLEPVEVITSRGLEDGNNYTIRHYRMVYDVCDLPFVIDDYGAAAADCLKAVAENDSLSKKYKDFFSDFIRRINEKYPDADLSILHHNLTSLRVVELDSLDYLTKSLSFDSLGCYMRNENTIYIPKGTVYTEGTFGFQVLIHEFCHAARTIWEEADDGSKLKIQLCSDPDNTIVEECLNSVFSCSLLHYYEWDIAYQVPSNYLRIMLECMDNYDLSDYINHSEQYFFKKLDEYSGYTNYAKVLWKLIALQRSDWSNDTIDIPTAEYRPICDFLCRLYYGKYITDGMTEAEKRSVADELIYKAYYDAPDGYKIETDRFYENLELYGK